MNCSKTLNIVLVLFLDNFLTVFFIGASLDGIYIGKIIEIKCAHVMAMKNLEPDELRGEFVIYRRKIVF